MMASRVALAPGYTTTAYSPNKNMRSQQNAAISIQSLSDEIATRLKALPSLKTEPVRAVRREFSRRFAKAPAADVVRLAMLIVRDTPLNLRWFGYELIFHH